MINMIKKLPGLDAGCYRLKENEQPNKDPKGRNITARDGAKRNPWKNGHSLTQPW